MPEMTYAPYEFDSDRFVKFWKVMRDGAIFNVFNDENSARHACNMPPIAGGDSDWPFRKVRAASGAANPANAGCGRVEPAEGPMRPGGTARHASPHETILDPLRHGMPPQRIVLPEGIDLAPLPADADPFVGYRVLGLPSPRPGFLLVSTHGEWQSLRDVMEPPGPIRQTLQEALDDLLETAPRMPVQAAAAPEAAEGPAEAGETWGMNRAPPATPLERIATALERIAATIEPPDSTGANIHALLWTLADAAEGIRQRMLG